MDFNFNSPEEEIFYPALDNFGIRLFFKRDDLIHPFISGNKWRKLKYNLTLAQQNGKNHLVTFGGAYSNHLLATAAAGAKFNFKTTAFVRGENVSNEVLAICKIFGMQLNFVDRETYKNKSLLYQQYFGNNALAYFINEGGAGLQAELGCRDIVTELQNSYDHVFCSAGTGTTVAGIINGLNVAKIQSKVHVVSALKNGDFLNNAIDALLINPSPYTLHTQYDCGGYAKTNPHLIQLIKNFASATGILLDPVYTAKTFSCIVNLASNNYFAANAKILMVHTGGLFGILGMKQKF
jgi:1-aminocyclopropane-1-carboxylate deaminase